MADITMCINGKECKKRGHCRRWLATPHGMQSWAVFYQEGKTCDHYLSWAGNGLGNDQ